MIETTGVALAFRAFFTEYTLGKSGLTVTVDVYDEAGTEIVSDAAATDIGGGLYSYSLASGSNDAAGLYTSVFKTASVAVDARHVPGQYISAPSWVARAVLALPSVAAGANGGLPTVDASNKIAGIVGIAFPATPASQAEVLAIQNNTSTRVVVPDQLVIPSSGSTDYILDLYIYDDAGNMEAPDSEPTLAVVNQGGTDRSGNLSAVSNPATGHYRVTYNVDTADTAEQLRWTWTVVEGGATRLAGATSNVVTEAQAGSTPPTVGQIRTEMETAGGKLDIASVQATAAATQATTAATQSTTAATQATTAATQSTTAATQATAAASTAATLASNGVALTAAERAKLRGYVLDGTTLTFPEGATATVVITDGQIVSVTPV